jgi:hypothetical protein
MATLNEDDIRAVMNAAGNCMLVMLENASFIQEELPNVTLDDTLRARAQDICSSLVGTRHDISTELDEFSELLNDPSSSEKILMRIERIIIWIRKDIFQMHELVTVLAAAAKRDPACGSAYFLIAESATNILHAFNQTLDAADKVKNVP